LEPPLRGFSVSSDGRALAVFSGAKVVRCALQPDGGTTLTSFSEGGVATAAFDFDGELWLSRGGLYHATDAGLIELEGVKPQALCGTKYGVVAVQDDAVVAVRGSGELAGGYKLP